MSSQRYRKHAGSVYNLNLHFVWCPKYRKPVLTGAVAERLTDLLHEKAAALDVEVKELEVMPDHVHLFVSCDPTHAPQFLANQFKGYTSRILRQEFAHLRSQLPSLWSRSYYVGAAGTVTDTTIRRYIEQQKTRS
jgi:putative transposase